MQKTNNGKAGYLLLVRGKTDEDFREAPLSLEAYAAILAWRERCPINSPSLFLALSGRGARWQAHPMTTVAVWQTVQHYANQCQLSAIKPHDLRRFVGTQLARANIRQAQQALGLGESYRRSLFALLSDAPQGLTFRDLVEALRTRQGHAVHRGTIRALLSTGGFVRCEGRWRVACDSDTGARHLRAALAQTLLPASEAEDEPRLEHTNTAKRLRAVASAIQTRLQQITRSLKEP